MSCFRAVRYIVAVLVVLTLGLFVAAGVLDYWWVVGKSRDGMLLQFSFFVNIL